MVLFANVNVGFHTLEIGTVQVSGIQNGNLKVETAANVEVSVNAGVHQLVKELKRSLMRQFDKPFKSEQAMNILENGGLMFNGEWQKYELPLDIKDGFNKSIYNHMTNVYSDDDLVSLYRFINTGGGANITKSVFADIPQLLVSKKPQWDTVKGYEALGKYYMRVMKGEQ